MGSFVGETVGSAVGASEGTANGSAVGDSVGCAEGGEVTVKCIGTPKISCEFHNWQFVGLPARTERRSLK